MILKHLFIPLTGLALISLASQSQAAIIVVTPIDYKTQPGIACQPADNAQAGNLGKVATGYIFNKSAPPLTVYCPIVRDTYFSSQAYAEVKVQSAGGVPLFCGLHSMNSNGGLIAVVNNNTTASTPTTLSFNLSSAQSGAPGTYAMICTLPRNGRVYNYVTGDFSFNTDSYN